MLSGDTSISAFQPFISNWTGRCIETLRPRDSKPLPIPGYRQIKASTLGNCRILTAVMPEEQAASVVRRSWHRSVDWLHGVRLLIALGNWETHMTGCFMKSRCGNLAVGSKQVERRNSCAQVYLVWLKFATRRQTRTGNTLDRGNASKHTLM